MYEHFHLEKALSFHKYGTTCDVIYSMWYTISNLTKWTQNYILPFLLSCREPYIGSFQIYCVWNIFVPFPCRVRLQELYMVVISISAILPFWFIETQIKLNTMHCIHRGKTWRVIPSCIPYKMTCMRSLYTSITATFKHDY